MFLTQLRLDPRSAQARRDLANPYDMHRTLARAFATDDTVPLPRFLWRLEPSADPGQAVVQVQSERAPDWTFMLALPGYLRANQSPATKSVDLAALLIEGAAYRFRLVANPTVTRAGKRHGLVGEEAQLDWLARQAARAGFAVQAALVATSEPLRARKGGTRVSLLRVCFEGILLARDAHALSAALGAGIGHGKAFGCGLLSLARKR